MKNLILILLLSVPIFPQLSAQQVQEVKRSHYHFAFPEFKDAKVLQPFGRFVRAKANILLRNAALCYMEDGKIKQAYSKNLLGVEFDSVKYMKVDSMMARVVASKGYNHLVCVTKVDKERYEAETYGGDNLPYFQIPDLNVFLEIDSDKYTFDQGLPLKDTYYFIVKGVPVQATEAKIKKLVRPEMKRAFKNLMADRFWSWRDPESLRQLLEFLPQ